MTLTEKHKLVDKAYAKIVDRVLKEVVETDNPWPEGRILINNKYADPAWVLGITPRTDGPQHAPQDVFLWFHNYVLFGTAKVGTTRFSIGIPSHEHVKYDTRDVSHEEALFWTQAKEQVVLKWAFDAKIKETILKDMRTHMKALRDFEP